MTFLGAIPSILGDMIQKYCTKAQKNLRREDVDQCKDKCKHLKAQWKRIESFTRVRATVIQKISAHLQKYKKELQKKEKKGRKVK